MIKKVSSFLQTVRRKGRCDSKRTGRPGPLWRDPRGTIGVYVAITAPVLLGIGARALDLTRIMTDGRLLPPPQVPGRIQVHGRTVTHWLRKGHLRGY